MPAHRQAPTSEVSVARESTLRRWTRRSFHLLRWFFRVYVLGLGLLFAPITTSLGLFSMLISWLRGRHPLSLAAFIKDHLYSGIALLVLEVGLLHWFFPVTNIAVTALLGLLGAPIVWIIFASSLGVLGACILVTAGVNAYLHHHDPRPVQNQVPEEKAGLFKRVTLALVAFTFAPISTTLGLLITLVFKRHTSFADLIRTNPFIAFACMVLEVGLLHWLLPASNFVLACTASLVGAVLSPILWTLFILTAVFILYSLYKSISAPKASTVTPDQALNSSAAYDPSRRIPPPPYVSVASPSAPSAGPDAHVGQATRQNAL